MVELSDNVFLKTKPAEGQSKFWNRLAPTWKFKIGRFFERIIFGIVIKVRED
jgi:hypothetical protein